MKKFMRKQNPLARIIALWMAFILLIIPLIEHGGLPGTTKAESGTKNVVYDYAGSISDFSGTFQAAVDGEGNSYVAFSAACAQESVDTTCEKFKFSYAVAGNVTDTDGSSIYTISEYEMRFSQTVNSATFASFDDTNSISAEKALADGVDISSGDVCGYIKVTKGISTDGTSTEMIFTPTEYVKVVEFGFEDSSASYAPVWLGSDGSDLGVAADKYFNNVKITAATGNSDTVKYLYTTEADETKLTVNDWNGAADSPSSLSTEGTYYGYVGFFGSGATLPNKVVEVESGTSINIDATAPCVVSFEIRDSSGETIDPGEEISDIPYYYLDQNENNDDIVVFIKEDETTIERNLAEKLFIKCTDSENNVIDLECSRYSHNGKEGYSISDFDSKLTADTEYTLSILPVDALGNTGAEKVVAKIMRINPKLQIVNVKVTNAVEGYDATTLPSITGNRTNKVYELSATVTSGTPITNCVLYNNGSVTSSNKIHTFDAFPTDKTGGLYVYDVTFSLNHEEEYTYSNLKLRAGTKADENSNETFETAFISGSYMYDSVEPEIVSANVQMKDTNGSWINIPDELLNEDGVRCLKEGVNDVEFRYYVELKEAGSTIAQNSVIVYSGSDEKVLTSDGDRNSQGEVHSYWKYEITSGEILTKISDNDDVLSFKVKASDTAGNTVTDFDVTPKFMLSNGEIKISAVLCEKDENGSAGDELTGGDYTSSKQYVAVVEASSGYKIDKIVMSYIDVEGNPVTEEYAVADSENKYSEAEERWSVKKEITLPKLDNVNALLKDVKLQAVDTFDEDGDENTYDPQNSETVALGKILFDQTRPVVENTDADDKKFVDITEWKKEYTVNAMVVGGSLSSDAESKLAEVSYSISNSNGDVDKSYIPVGNGDSAELSIDVPESKTIEGTKITINAKDTAGNTANKNNEITVLVDKTAPKFAEDNGITFNGAAVSGVYAPEIKIGANVTDNLTLTSVRFYIYMYDDKGNLGSKPVMKSEKTLSNVETTDSGAKGSCIYKTGILGDGKYMLEAIVTDKAGLSSTSVKYFSVDGGLYVEHTITPVADGDTNQAIGEVIDTFGEKTISSNKHKVEATINSGYILETYVIQYKENGKQYSRPVDIPKETVFNGIHSAKISYVFGDGRDHVYEDIKIIAKDENGDEEIVELGTLVYDVTNPQITYAGLYKKTGDDWQKITDDMLYNGKYIVDATKEELYRYVFEVNEKTSGVREAYMCFASDTAKKNKINLTYNDDAKIAVAGANDEYYAEFNTAILFAYINGAYGVDAGTDGEYAWPVKSLAFTAHTVDNAELASTNSILTTPVRLQDIALHVEIIMKDANGQPVDLTNGAAVYTSDAYTITAQFQSGYPIKDVLLTENLGAADARQIYDVDITDAENSAGYNSVTKLYKFDKVINIPMTDLTLNQLINNSSITVTDTRKPEAQIFTKLIGTLLYDQTKPVIYNNKDAEKKFFVDDKWYSEYIIDATIKSGEQAVESNITDASYSITNSVDGDVEAATDGVTLVNGVANISYKLPESIVPEGTSIVFNAKDQIGDVLTSNNTATIRVDSTRPEITKLHVNGAAENDIPLSPEVKVTMDAFDNLAMSKVVVSVVQTDGEESYSQEYTYAATEALKNTEDGITVSEAYELTLPDGTYQVSVIAYDKAENPSVTKKTTFKVDGTVPVVTAKVLSGTMGGKSPSTNFDGTACDYYYSSDVTVQFTYKENNMDKVTVEHNGNEVNLNWSHDPATGLFVTEYLVTADELHRFNISARDMSGNTAEPKEITFVKDSAAPAVGVVVNGGIAVVDGMSELLLTSNASIGVSVSDVNEDAQDLNYQTIKNVPDQESMVSDYLKTTNRTFNFAEEADYTFNVYSIDMAGNTSATRTVSFRVDKTAPNITINGIGANGTTSNPVSLSFNMQEAFWRDATGSVRIYRQPGDGMAELLVEEFNYTPTAFQTSVSRSFAETGVYRVEFTASDRVGHNASTNLQFTIDTEAPHIVFTGVENYDVTDGTVEIEAVITEAFYASKIVSVTGSVTDTAGKVSPIAITDFNQAVNPTTINQMFTSDGIYDLTITATDSVGNSESISVHFTIDKTVPVIGDLSTYDGTILTSFNWDIDLDELVSDLTVCDVHMYLNGTEYNGEDEIPDGSYVLLITAEDDLGHKTEKSVEFILDTKAPVFIVTGVEDGEVKEEPYQISISLQLEEDTLTSVTLNGQIITVTGNVANIDITEEGEYTLVMTAVDEAGNQVSETIEFRLGQEISAWIWILIALAIVLVVSIFIIILLKRKKDRA